ncbi:hypothetical protein LTS18_009924 [Coniosporium uncinatum]|uniref:Uncharacterized protein n=1 Tax=Coniosporium uncinatum TaxID=93489 RepID=A0ACC3DM23_9PEZI|nr:hypothetical protein LTS18_009924 [Coniosporium uncinatum]
MPFQLDKEIQAQMGPLLEAARNAPKLAVDDIQGRRKAFERMLAMVNARGIAGDVKIKDYYTTTNDGYNMPLRWYTLKNKSHSSPPGPAVLYLHGGGMILANVGLYDHTVSNYVSQSGIPFLSVEFRSAPEQQDIVHDNYHALQWLSTHADELGVDPTRIAVMGDSGGGGLAACLAIYARDRCFSPAIAMQILIYPMLDDRNTKPNSHLVPFMAWDYDSNETAWRAILENDSETGIGGPRVSAYKAAARIGDAAGLPSAYIDVGDLDIFRDEDIEFAKRLTMAGVHCELHVRSGCPHGYDGFAPDTTVGKRANADKVRVLQSLRSGMSPENSKTPAEASTTFKL